MQEIEIFSIDDYCQKVNEICKGRSNVYFRGEPAFFHHRIPLLFRPRLSDSWALCLDNVSPKNYQQEDDESKYIANNAEDEKTLIDEALNGHKQDFFDCDSSFDELCVMQHYGMITKLLDVSFNPLVALFFSCYDKDSKHQDKNGYIYWGDKEIDDLENAKIISSLNKMLPNQQNKSPIPVDTFDIEDIKKWLSDSCSCCDMSQINDTKLIQLITSDYLVKADTNDRMRNQSGAVIISSCLSSVQGEPKLFRRTTKPLNKYFDNEKCFVVHSHLKPKLLQELDSRGISESFIFPDDNRSLKQISQKYNKQEFPWTKF